MTETAVDLTSYVGGRFAEVSPVLGDAAIAATWHDLRRLRALAKASYWDDTTPIPASFFAEPLWPNGEPARWP